MENNKILASIQKAIEKIEKKLEEQDSRLRLIEKNQNNNFSNNFDIEIEADKQEEKLIRESYVRNQDVIQKNIFDFKKLEDAVGAYLFQIIGIIVFLLGMVFLFQYTIEQNLITPFVRVCIGAVLATGLIGFGELYTKNKWTKACIAGGVILYYITLFGATILYSMLSVITASLLSIVITALAFGLSIRHNSVALAALSLLGGFLTPLFTSGKNYFFIHKILQFNSDYNLFVIFYLMGLAIAFSSISLIKQWGIIAAGSFFFMNLYMYSTMVKLLSLEGQLFYIVGFYIIFGLIPYLYALQNDKESKLLEVKLIGATGLISLVSSINFINEAIYKKQLIQDSWLHYFFNQFNNVQVLKSILFISGFIYLVKTIIAIYSKVKNKDLMQLLFLKTVLPFFGVIVLHFQDFGLGMGIQIYSLVTFALSNIFRSSLLRFFSWLFFVIGFLVYLANITHHKIYHLLIYNDLNIATGLLLIIFAVASYGVSKYQSDLDEYEKKYLITVFDVSFYLTFMLWLHSPIWEISYRLLVYPIVLLTFFASGLFLQKGHLSKLTMYLFLFYTWCFAKYHHGLYKGNLYNIISKNTLVNSMYIITIGALLLSILLLRKYKKKLSEKEFEYFSSYAELAITIFGFMCIRQNITFFIEQHKFYKAVLAMYYAASGLSCIFIGLIYKRHFIRYVGFAFSLFALTELWFVIINMQESLHKIVSFIVIGSIFIIVSFVYQKLSKNN